MRSERASVCPLDCPDTCSLTVTVEAERIVQIRGSRANPVHRRRDLHESGPRSRGLRPRGPPANHPAAAHGGEGRRSLRAYRLGAALDLVHGGLTGRSGRTGPQAVVPLNYAGPTGSSPTRSMDLRFFHGSAPACSTGSPSAAASAPRRGSGPTGRCPASRPEQAALEAGHRLGQQRHLVEPPLHVDHATRPAGNGAKLVVVDPRRTKIAEQADLHLALRPGTDVVLAWAVTAELERRGALDRAFIDSTSAGFEAYMARARRRDPRRGRADLPRARGDRSASWPSGTRRSRRRRSASATGSSATRTAGAASARSSRCPRSPGSSASPGRPRQRRRLRVPEDPGAAPAARPRPAGHAHPQHRRHRRAPPRPELRPADQGALRLQPQSRRRPPGPEPSAPRPRARGPLHRRGRRGHDRQHGLRGRRPAGLRATSSTTTSTPPTASTGSSAPSR